MHTLTNQWSTTVIKKGDISLFLLSTGDVFKWMHGEHQINLLQGNPFDGMIANLYLREKMPQGYRVSKLLGIHSPSHWQATDDGAIYQGTIWGLSYQVHLIVNEQGWQYLVNLQSLTHTQAVYDLMYGQDIGIGHPFGILMNEAYTSQYIDHQIFTQDEQHTILSRQNQGLTHYLQVGCSFPTMGYATDIMQFFGLDYKLTHTPVAYQLQQLPSQNYQYEFAYPALQTKPFSLSPTSRSISFYGLSVKQDGLFLTSPLVTPVFESRPTQPSIGQPSTNLLTPSNPLIGLPLETKELHIRYPNLKQVEMSPQQELLSAFTDDGNHLITQQKELLVERPHGHILLSGDVLHASEDVFATTAYMFGVFGSHTVYGNANFHKLTGDLRHPLNAHSISGTRLYVHHQGRYQLLGMPSFILMSLDQVEWHYKLKDDEWVITLAVNGLDPISKLTFKSLQHKSYSIILTQQFLLDTNEYQPAIQYTQSGQSITIDGSSNSFIANHYPGLRYQLTLDQPFQLKLSKDFIQPSLSDGGMIFLELNNVSQFNFYVQATLNHHMKALPEQVRFDRQYRTFIKQFLPLHVEHPQHQTSLDAFNLMVPWYVHDALVHYASPHGLEQYNGAAWGTRDVLQGPFELFLTAQRFDLNREILLKVFARQFTDTKEFPQWFMFDNYRNIQAHESHGDVTVWPLKALANYLEATGDLSILKETIPYMDKHKGTFTDIKTSLSEHVWDIIKVLQQSAIKGTSLPAYGGGDWDDTLQPANQTLTKQMVSGWTVALLYEALNLLTEWTIFDDDRQRELGAFKVRLKKDFETYLLVDGIPAGFVIFYPDHREVLLHPQDQKTGLQYRLLPFNRGMISHLFDSKNIDSYQTIMRQHLRHPDGVRLMNTAVTYQGGKKTYFQRAETAANFGREIGIQYVHAHIRYIEAMTTIGNAEEAWWGLNVINPIGMQTLVPHAERRQRNVYFSSSDAAFLDRYQAKRDFEKVRKGTVKVKAGWRLYSSGPGIYLRTYIHHFLGIKVQRNTLIIDPVIPSSLKGLTITFQFQGQPLKVVVQDLTKKKTTRNPYRLASEFKVEHISTGLNVILK
jgi:cellobiose phosphorylase